LNKSEIENKRNITSYIKPKLAAK